jgi:hypothetical protein
MSKIIPNIKFKSVLTGLSIEERNHVFNNELTEEENINNLWKYIQFPLTLIGREKVDGSSISIFAKYNGAYGICSRKLQKKLYIKKVIGQRKKTLLETLMFWSKPNLNIYKEELSDSDFITIGKPVLDKLINYVSLRKQDIVLRGELCGEGCKGSGNKNNPHAKLPKQILFYGVDDYSDTAKKLSESNYRKVTTDLELNTPKLVFNQLFSSKEDLLNACNEYFKTNMIEGIVVRNYDHTFSAKIINPEYDSKK